MTQLASGRGCLNCNCSGSLDPDQDRREPEPSDRSWLGEQPCPVLVPGSPSNPRVVSGEVGGMAWPGEREASMSVLERLLANAALRDEAGRLRNPEPQARPPSGPGVSQGKLGGGAGSLVPLLSWAS